MTDLDTPAEHPVIPWLTQPRRAWIYRIVTAAIPLLVIANVVTENVATAVVGVVAAVLATATAAVNTPTK